MMLFCIIIVSDAILCYNTAGPTSPPARIDRIYRYRERCAHKAIAFRPGGLPEQRVVGGAAAPGLQGGHA